MEYSKSRKLFHWLIALSVIGIGTLGLYMEGLEKSGFKFILYDYHKAFGVLALLFIIGLMVSRVGRESPQPPSGLSRGAVLTAKIVKLLMIVLIFAVIIFGYLASSAFPLKEGIWFFGVELPAIIGKDKELSHSLIEIHNTLAITLLAVSLLHILGVLKHRFFDKENDVLERML